LLAGSITLNTLLLVLYALQPLVQLLLCLLQVLCLRVKLPLQFSLFCSQLGLMDKAHQQDMMQQLTV
jgi:hypothetical protein